ncbi:MAG: adenylate kinase [Actinobacteria bacterium]|nr:adenylate kinase [Actinomycetota bacterium]
MPLDIIVVGPPGAGKGTQARRIAADAGIPHIATGDMLRAEMAAATDLGRQIKPIYDRGDLVPDDFMVELIRRRLRLDDTASGFLLDGFPRTLEQAEALDRMLVEIGRSPAIVLEFQLSDGVAEERLLRRATEEGRVDDAADVVRHRLSLFRAETEKVIEHYRAKGILVGVHAGRSINEVFAEIQLALEQAASRSDSPEDGADRPRESREVSRAGRTEP